MSMQNIPVPFHLKNLGDSYVSIMNIFTVNRLEFEWAEHYYVELEASVKKIHHGLDLWQAVMAREGSSRSVPWKAAEDLYHTIDAIQAGHAPWKTFTFKYAGPKPPIPPQWMLEEYELNVRDVLVVLEEQLGTSEFEGEFDYTPYQEFNSSNERVYSNLMSGQWAFQQADLITEDPKCHGAMFVPVIAGSDKTTVSVATGHQEYHPVYVSLGNISNTARRAHGNGVMPVAFLPIPKTNKTQRKKPAFQKFCRQLYHRCLEFVFQPLRPFMTTPKVVKCPDGHFRKAIFGLGPYIADYPEQVYLAGVVSNWCPKCDANPTNLDGGKNHMRTHEKTDFLLTKFDPGILWDEFGIRNDVVPFTYFFPRADIHELLAPDILHQLIKGVFKDHLVTWVCEYLHHAHGEKRALEIITDIDHRSVHCLTTDSFSKLIIICRISTVPPFPGLRRFPDGRDFTQWTGDDSKALMKVYLAAIAGYLPSSIVQCISAFLDACYLARRNAITGPMLKQLEQCVARFHNLHNAFIFLGVRSSISLPRQHALPHYLFLILLFGAPNGLCSSITESKHVKAVKRTWRRSSRFKALHQMLQTITRLEKMAAARREFTRNGMMVGSTLGYTAQAQDHDNTIVDMHFLTDEADDGLVDEDDDDSDGGPVEGASQDESLFEVQLSRRPEPGYPRYLSELANVLQLPQLPQAFRQFLYFLDNPVTDPSACPSIHQCPDFHGQMRVHHSAMATFFSPSDLCGVDDTKDGIHGLEVARVLLFFSFSYRRKKFSCALVNWLVQDDPQPDPDTGMWSVSLELDDDGMPTYQVIDAQSIARGAHLLPVFGSEALPEPFDYRSALDSFNSFFINRFIDHHAHEFLSI
ncbi:hypothetical protein BYT27DRAFT_7222511 [Phlegmacium glaucopus]|nr:hypothetical protein BYT27DRAFT_7222511 [Phlegmacium glaucopus]